MRHTLDREKPHAGPNLAEHKQDLDAAFGSINVDLDLRIDAFSAQRKTDGLMRVVAPTGLASAIVHTGDENAISVASEASDWLEAAVVAPDPQTSTTVLVLQTEAPRVRCRPVLPLPMCSSVGCGHRPLG